MGRFQLPIPQLVSFPGFLNHPLTVGKDMCSPLAAGGPLKVISQLVAQMGWTSTPASGQEIVHVFFG